MRRLVAAAYGILRRSSSFFFGMNLGRTAAHGQPPGNGSVIRTATWTHPLYSIETPLESIEISRRCFSSKYLMSS